MTAEELIARVRADLEGLCCCRDYDDESPEGRPAEHRCIDYALEALDTLARRLKELRTTATKLCNQYRNYEEFDPLRELLGLPSYFDMLAEPNTQDAK